MFWLKTIKLQHRRIDTIWEGYIKMSKKIENIEKALENTVYAGMNEDRIAIAEDRERINKIIAKLWKKKVKDD